MLKDILSNIVIYDHLCRRIVKQANQITDKLNFKKEDQLKNILNDTKRAERLRTELIYQTNKLKIKLKDVCLNCNEKSSRLRNVKLTEDKKAPLCATCYTSMVSGYIGNILH